MWGPPLRILVRRAGEPRSGQRLGRRQTRGDGECPARSACIITYFDQAEGPKPIIGTSNIRTCQSYGWWGIDPLELGVAVNNPARPIGGRAGERAGPAGGAARSLSAAIIALTSASRRRG